MSWVQFGILAFILIGLGSVVAMGFEALVEHLAEIRDEVRAVRDALESIDLERLDSG